MLIREKGSGYNKIESGKRMINVVCVYEMNYLIVGMILKDRGESYERFF